MTFFADYEMNRVRQEIRHKKKMDRENNIETTNTWAIYFPSHEANVCDSV